jgi:hypothetical protein
MKHFCCLLLALMAVGCNSNTGSAAKPEAPKGKVYSLEEVDQELNAGGVKLEAPMEDVQTFFKAHPEYQVCMNNDGALIAVMRNKKVDPKADDQFIVIAYRDGKVANRDIGPPQFSVGNPEKYCR